MPRNTNQFYAQPPQQQIPYRNTQVLFNYQPNTNPMQQNYMSRIPLQPQQPQQFINNNRQVS
jgi:hypothetical protein